MQSKWGRRLSGGSRLCLLYFSFIFFFGIREQISLHSYHSLTYSLQRHSSANSIAYLQCAKIVCPDNCSLKTRHEVILILVAVRFFCCPVCGIIKCGHSRKNTPTYWNNNIYFKPIRPRHCDLHSPLDSTPKSSFPFDIKLDFWIELQLQFQLHGALKICISFGFLLVLGLECSCGNVLPLQRWPDITHTPRSPRKYLFWERAIRLPNRRGQKHLRKKFLVLPIWMFFNF